MSSQYSLKINSTLTKEDVLSTIQGPVGSTPALPTVFSGVATKTATSGFFPILNPDGTQLALPAGIPTMVTLKTELTDLADLALFGSATPSLVPVAGSTTADLPGTVISAVVDGHAYTGISYPVQFQLSTIKSLPVQAKIPSDLKYYNYIFSPTSTGTGTIDVSVRMV